MIMSSDFDIYRLANPLISRYGKEAPIRAGKQADEFNRKNDYSGCVIWLMTITLIFELLICELRDNPVARQRSP